MKRLIQTTGSSLLRSVRTRSHCRKEEEEGGRGAGTGCYVHMECYQEVRAKVEPGLMTGVCNNIKRKTILTIE